jgi:hypothetical protein
MGGGIRSIYGNVGGHGLRRGWLVLDPIFRLRILNRLPLHVARIIRAAVFQSLNVIDHVAGASAGSSAGGRAQIRPLEGSPLRRITLDAAVAPALAGGALRIRGSGVCTDAPAPGTCSSDCRGARKSPEALIAALCQGSPKTPIPLRRERLSHVITIQRFRLKLLQSGLVGHDCSRSSKRS